MRKMAVIAVLLVYLTIEATFAEKCPHPVICPCGSKGYNVTICAKGTVPIQVCSRLSKCEACEDGYKFCTKCPEGLEGPTCSREIRKNRQKRQLHQTARWNIQLRNRRSPNTSRSRNCMYPGNVVNGRVEYIPVFDRRIQRPSSNIHDEYPEGSRLLYYCEEGYILDGPTILTCKSTGSWSPAVPPTCITAHNYETAVCDNPGRVLNGKVSYFAPGDRNGPGMRLESEMEEYPEGSILEYYCDKGFWLQGPHSLKCDSTGFWSDRRPTCVGDCGRSFVKTSNIIRYGQETVTGEWPWVVSISVQENNSSRFVCGGAVFNTRTVITAAHCLKEDHTYILRFGKHHFNIEDDDSDVLKRTSSRVIIHPDYSHRTFDSDIGLIVFEPRLEYSSRVQPICLPTIETTLRNIRAGKVGYVSGWGDTELEHPSDSLLFAGLPVLDKQSCLRQNLTVAVTANMFCAGYYNETYSVCGGDSGSPFVFYDNLSHRYTLEGLVSFVVRKRQDAQACGLPGRYAIFTRVVRFVPWIYENAG